MAGDGQGRNEHEDVFFGGDDQAVFAAGVADLGGVFFVFDFDADGEGPVPVAVGRRDTALEGRRGRSSRAPGEVGNAKIRSGALVALLPVLCPGVFFTSMRMPNRRPNMRWLALIAATAISLYLC